MAIAPVVVEYVQVAAFRVYLLDPNSTNTHGAGDGVFIMYKIKQIKNPQNADSTFVFDVDKVSTIAPDKTSNETVTSANILLINENVTTVTVNPGQTKVVQRCFIKQALTSDPLSIIGPQVPLRYEKGDLRVEMDNLTPNGTVAQVTNALPATLHSLCKSTTL